MANRYHNRCWLKSTRSNSSAEVHPSFPLLRLPLEIRLLIYEFHFIQAGEPPTEIIPCRNYPYVSWITSQYELFTVSKQLYAEAMPLYFRTRIFRFIGSTNLIQFLSAIGPYQRQHIRHISYYIDLSFLRQVCKHLSRCPSLQRLSLTLQTARDSSDYRHRPMPGMQFLGKIRGLMAVECTYVRWVEDPPHWASEKVFVPELEILKQPYNSAEIKAREDRGICRSNGVRTDFTPVPKPVPYKSTSLLAQPTDTGVIDREGKKRRQQSIFHISHLND